MAGRKFYSPLVVRLKSALSDGVWAMRMLHPAHRAAVVIFLAALFVAVHAVSQYRLSAQLSTAIAAQQNRPLAVDRTDRYRRQVQQRLARLPDFSSLATHLNALHRLAKKHGVLLATAHYRQNRQPGGLRILRITQNTAADYPKLRAYLSDIQSQMPNVAVEQLRLQRPSIERPAINAAIVLSMYFGDAPP